MNSRRVTLALVGVAIWLLRGVLALAPDRILALTGLIALVVTTVAIGVLPDYRDATRDWLNRVLVLDAGHG